MNIEPSDITFKVDGIGASPKLIIVPPMSLSSQREKMTQHSFVLSISIDALCAHSKPHWDDYVAQCKADEKRLGGPDENDWVAKKGYPPLATVLEDQEELELLFVMGGRLLEPTISSICRAWPENKTPLPHEQFYLDRYSVRKVGEIIVWKGVCYQKQ